METNNEQFIIAATISGKQEQIRVEKAETTDGVDFYKCSIGENEITQIRKEADGWKQLWGELPGEEITAIGTLIDAYLDQDRIVS